MGHRIVEIDAGHWAGHHVLGAGKVVLGKVEEAVALHERAVELGGGAPWLRGWLGLAYGAAGRHAEARALLAGLLEMSSHASVSPTAVALTCIGPGEVDAAFEWMERAAEVRDPHIIPIRTYPCFDGLRDDDRFRAILGKMNLTEAC